MVERPFDHGGNRSIISLERDRRRSLPLFVSRPAVALYRHHDEHTIIVPRSPTWRKPGDVQQNLNSFADAYLFTGDALFLETAERCAEYYLTNTPEGGVPYWDYGAPNIPEEPLDSSAAAIVAGAFWKLKNIEGTRQNSQTYRNGALAI